MLLQVSVEKKMLGRGRNFSLNVAFTSQQESVVLFGPSGSGKTLTLHSIAGLMAPDAGRIVLNGRVLFDAEKGINLPPRHRGIGYVFQDYALFPHLTVLENVGFGLKKNWQWRLCRKEKRQVMEFLELLEIPQLAHSFPLDLSGGQKQRVALARALILKPDLLLLDEPFAALDTLLRVKLRKELAQIQASFGIPVIMVTHDPEDIRAFAETLVIYEMGGTCEIRQFLKTNGTNLDELLTA
ncbi:MAG: ATP-binding cassette domain-containing protein [Syntrophobacteraceae bacterium]